MASPKEKIMIRVTPPKAKRALSPTLPELPYSSPYAAVSSIAEDRAAKRQRIASSASQDSDENGQNALGISFGEPVAEQSIIEDEGDEEGIEEMAESEEAKDKKGKKVEIADSQDLDDLDDSDDFNDDLEDVDEVDEETGGDEEDSSSEEDEDNEEEVSRATENNFVPVNPVQSVNPATPTKPAKKRTPLPNGRPGSILSSSDSSQYSNPRRRSKLNSASASASERGSTSNPTKQTPFPTGKPRSVRSVSSSSEETNLPHGSKLISVPTLASGSGSSSNWKSDDVKRRLSNGKYFFSLHEIKSIARWIRMHRSYRITTHKEDFNDLLTFLGFAEDNLSAKEKQSLRAKLRSKMAYLYSMMLKSGAIPDGMEEYESSGSNVIHPLAFAEWTRMWFKKGWDGSLNKPDQATYEAVMNEPDDDEDIAAEMEQGSEKVVEKGNIKIIGKGKGKAKVQDEDAEVRPSDKGKGKGKAKAQDDDLKVHKPASRLSSVETGALRAEEERPAAPISHHDDNYDGIEIFVVEEDPLPTANPPPTPTPPKNDFSEARNWDTYLLNKEIIDAQDWNHRIMIAQNLGHDLKDVAALYPDSDPFPGYEAPARQESEDSDVSRGISKDVVDSIGSGSGNSATATKKAPVLQSHSSVSSVGTDGTGMAKGSKGVKTSARRVSDKSIDIGSLDSDDGNDDVEREEDVAPGLESAGIELPDEEDDVMGDDEMDEEDGDEDLASDDLTEVDQGIDEDSEEDIDMETPIKEGQSSQASGVSAASKSRNLSTEPGMAGPSTPRRAIGRLSMTPGSKTPGTPSYAAYCSHVTSQPAKSFSSNRLFCTIATMRSTMSMSRLALIVAFFLLFCVQSALGLPAIAPSFSSSTIKSTSNYTAPLSGNISLYNDASQIPAGYDIVDPRFTGSFFGIPVDHIGTIESLVHQLDSDPTNDFSLSALLADFAAKDAIAASNVTTRSTSYVNHVQCSGPPNQHWTPASTIAIAASINILSQSKLNLHLPKNSCASISCSHSSGIFACNDNIYPITHPLAQYGDMALDLRNQCSRRKNDISEFVTLGQAFDDGGFSVSILRTDCKKLSKK
ncbi:hypothetical protein VTL71DRAFT_12051 [Oculimacula yallundae]|uniref:Uncharacterized protein n=1 Tax=Oculimacula yallundae TaxID=86028 RepID=A0ABR4CRS5_9HELO